MSVTIKCPDCGHSEESKDGAAKTCPECEGKMTAPPKKKYQAKSTSLEEEALAKKKAKRDEDDDDRPKKKASRRIDDDEEDEKPAKKAVAKKKPRDEDEDDDEKGGSTRNSKAAERLGLDPGFKNKELMKQVEEELSRGEVLYFACRPSEEIAKKKALMAALGGIFFSLIGLGIAVAMLTVLSDKIPVYVVTVPCIFVLVGILLAILGPIMTKRQAKMGWYAVTDRRAIVFNINLWGKAGHVEVYPPEQLRKMWIKKSFWVKGGGDLIFRTEVHDNRTRYVDRRTGQTVKQTGTRTEHHFGFLGIEDVKEVEALIHEVLLSRRRDDEDDEDDDD